MAKKIKQNLITVEKIVKGSLRISSVHKDLIFTLTDKESKKVFEDMTAFMPYAKQIKRAEASGQVKITEGKGVKKEEGISKEDLLKLKSIKQEEKDKLVSMRKELEAQDKANQDKIAELGKSLKAAKKKEVKEPIQAEIDAIVPVAFNEVDLLLEDIEKEIEELDKKLK